MILMVASSAILFGGDPLESRDPVKLKRIIEVKNADSEQQSARM